MMKRTVTLLLMTLMVVTTAFSQATRSRGESKIPGGVSPKGDNWETFTFNNQAYNYFKGSDVIDNINVENLLGGHWKGATLEDVIQNGDTIYLCNVATGEYLLVGDYWGETSMTNHVGLPYVLLSGTSTRRWGALPDMGSGYWIQPMGVREARVIGRASRNDGVAGHFEENGYLFLRHQVEYEGDKSAEHPGGFLFKFKPVTTSDGKQAYFIYTHRKTEMGGNDDKWFEYFNRDSYLMVSSIDENDNQQTDYTKVRFKKFAGQMFGPTPSTVTVTLSDQTNLSTITTNAEAQAATDHKYGVYSDLSGGYYTTYTTTNANVADNLAGVVLTADEGAKMKAGYYGPSDTKFYEHYKHFIGLHPADTDEHTLTLTAPDGYVITGYDIGATGYTSGRMFYMTREDAPDTTYAIGGAPMTNISVKGILKKMTSFTIKAQDARGDYHLSIPKFTVTLERLSSTSTDVTLGDQEDIVADNDNAARSNNEHKYGTYNNANGGNTYTTNATSGMAGVTVTADGNYMNAAWYENSNYLHTMRFHPGNTDPHTITISAPAGYVITGYRIKAIVNSGNCPYTVTGATEPVGTSLTEISESGLTQDEVILTIQKQPTNGANGGLCFPKFSVTLKKLGDDIEGDYAGGVVHTGGKAYRNLPLGDEVAFYNKNRNKPFVSFDEGLNDVIGDPHNLWKLVTKKQRDRYRIVASEAKPVDVTSRIFNPKFNTTYLYNVSKDTCHWDTDDLHWELNKERLHPDYGWTWYNTDRPNHDDEVHKQHVHPFNLKSTDSGYWGIGKELHKVGTGQFFRFWDVSGGGGFGDGQEMAMTYGQEANYCGSIYHGTANLQQTVTGLREGNYVVFVRGFFAPHNMQKYTRNKDNNNYQFNNAAMGSANQEVDGYNWKEQALIRVEDDGTPVWRRSHDSYLFAWSTPNWNPETQTGTKEEVRRMLPSVYEGATKIADIGNLSKEAYIDSDELKYTQVGTFNTNIQNGVTSLMRDSCVYAFYNGSFFGLEGGNSYIVPKTVTGAGRFFNATNKEAHSAAQNYRIGLPVYVGGDGELTIGVDHTYIKGEEPYNSGDHEWVCFDEFELIYLGKDEGELFIIDEQNGQGKVGGYDYINGETGLPFTAADTEAPNFSYVYGDTYEENKKSPEATRQNNTKWLDIFDTFDITNEELLDAAKVVKNVVIRRTMTTNGWNSIVLPVPLTRAQVEEGFGKDTKVSQLKTVRGRVLVYEPVPELPDGTYLKIGKPYIIYPTENPLTSVGEDFEREPFTINNSTTWQGVAGLYFKSGQYYRNFEIDHKLEGPIYFVPDVEIKMSDVFPNPDEATGTDQWQAPESFSKDVKVAGNSNSFKLKERAFYENPGTVPQYSYYYNKGQIRYATSSFNTTKGLLSYIQLTYMEDGQEIVYSKPFLDADVEFIIDESGTSGIDDVFDLPDDPLNVTIYDLQGRKVNTPRPGNIYIMNGKKVVF